MSIRLAGIQAMEQHVYSPNPAKRRGDSHALEATARFKQLIKVSGGRKIRVTSPTASSQSGERPLRSVAVKIGDKLLREDPLTKPLDTWLAQDFGPLQRATPSTRSSNKQPSECLFPSRRPSHRARPWPTVASDSPATGRPRRLDRRDAERA
ncbi:hypothetical protein [Actinoplanes couchii]|uniref:hypothetical protein n=1 Tax=Actinoplanes couchii TaxID=403638 RepID=UPI001944DE59|nr:hypothetical protein [Actinoplanes couchii]MDR6321992.1 hypothetical protein [Actinoplanes couchii]